MHAFEAEIYKIGINWAVDVPDAISAKLARNRGYIPIQGTIDGFAFTQTLVPVKNAPYRLFVNGLMMKGAQTAVGKTAAFRIEQGRATTVKDFPIPEALQTALHPHGLASVFAALSPSRQKEILRYFSFLKSEEAMRRNVDKLVARLLQDGASARIP